MRDTLPRLLKLELEVRQDARRPVRARLTITEPGGLISTRTTGWMPRSDQRVRALSRAVFLVGEDSLRLSAKLDRLLAKE